MPTNKKHYMRDYKRAHPEKWYNPKEMVKQGERRKARAAFAKKMGVSPGELKGDVDHKVPLRHGGGSGLKNLRLLSQTKNRGWRKGGKR